MTMFKDARTQQLATTLAYTCSLEAGEVDPSPSQCFAADKKVDEQTRAIHNSLFCGKGWTNLDLHEAGYHVDPMCALLLATSRHPSTQGVRLPGPWIRSSQGGL